MKTMTLTRFGSELTAAETGTPRLEPGEALLRVRACGLCGTDLKIWNGLIPTVRLPHVMGHEIAGEVVDIAPPPNGCDETELRPGPRSGPYPQPGTRAVVYVYVTCGKCVNCRGGRDNICTGGIRRFGIELPGGFADYVKVPLANLYPIAESLSFESACILSDAVVTALHAVVDRAGVRAGETVVVKGAGGVGIHALQVCRRLGARVVVLDVRDECLAMAAELGADVCVNVRQDSRGAFREGSEGARDGAGADVVLDTVGTAESLRKSLELLTPGGRAVSIGYSPTHPLHVDTLKMHLNEWQLLGTRHGTRRNLVDAMRMAANGEIIPMVGRTFPLGAANEALDALALGRAPGRIVLVNQ